MSVVTGDDDTQQFPRAVVTKPRYTLAELRILTREFLTDMEIRGHVTTYGAESLIDWKFETFLQWLAKREQRKESDN